VTDLLQDDPQAVILAADQAQLWAQAAPYRAWSLVGQTPVLTVAAQRYRVVFYGALELATGEEQAIMTDKMTRLTTVTFIQYLLARYPHRRILLLLDRATWHFGPPIDALLAQQPRLELFYLPTACPELNPQEHVWAAVRRAVTRDTTFPKLVDRFLYALHTTRFRPLLFDHYAPSILSVLSG
jgi:transposase